MVVRESARHLADDGFATVLCNWIHDGDWAAAIRPWVAETGCDALLLHYASLDPVNYAMRWNADLKARDPRAFEATVRRWLDYFRGERIEHIAFGGMILRRRESASSHWVRALEMSEGPTGPCSDQILRLFDAADFLESPAGQGFVRARLHARRRAHHQTRRSATEAGSMRSAPAIFRVRPRARPGGAESTHARSKYCSSAGPTAMLGDLVEATARDRGESLDSVQALVGETVRQLSTTVWPERLYMPLHVYSFWGIYRAWNPYLESLPSQTAAPS